VQLAVCRAGEQWHILLQAETAESVTPAHVCEQGVKQRRGVVGRIRVNVREMVLALITEL